MNFILNPRNAIVGIPVAITGLLTIGFLFSYPDLAQAKQKADAAQKAIDRADGCLIVDRIHEGHYYATTETKGTKVWETLIPDGNYICSADGSTAMINGKVATFIRRAPGADIMKKISDRFGKDDNGQTVIPPEFKAIKSTVYVADMTKRPLSPGKREPGVLDWLFPQPKQGPQSSLSIKK